MVDRLFDGNGNVYPICRRFDEIFCSRNVHVLGRDFYNGRSSNINIPIEKANAGLSI